MSKTEATKRRKRQSKVVISEAAEEEDNTTTTKEIVGTEENKDVEMNQAIEETGDKKDCQKDTVIEVKGSSTTVTVSWEKKNEEKEGGDAEKRTNTSDQMTDGEPAQTVAGSGAVRSTEDAPSNGTDAKMEDVEDKQESQMNSVTEENESTATVTVTWEEKNEEGGRSDIKKESKQMMGKKTAVKGKRKAESTAVTSPSKKTKLINDGFCLFVGNLNNSKKPEDVKNSLANYFNIQSLLVQDIRLDRSRKHAFVDLASEMDLTKALTLNGEMVLDKPMRIAKAKVKSEEKVKPTPEDKKAARDARCLFLKNVPYDATETDILKVFPNAIAVRFPGGAESPDKGIAFLEFKSEVVATKVKQHKQGAKIRDRVLIVDRVGETQVSKVSKDNDDDNNNTKAAAPPNKVLFVSNLTSNVTEKNIRKVFQTAVTISIPQKKGKSKGFAFVEFATAEDAEKALQSSQNIQICKKEISVQFRGVREKVQKEKGLKTLAVMGLAKKTTAETLKSAFEGALSARVTVDKEKGVSKGFGFVEFESEESCKAAKEAMEDCEIDGSKVTVAFAKQKGERGRPVAKGGSTGRPGGKPAGKSAGGGRGGKGKRGGKGRGDGKSKNGVKKVKK